MFQTSQSTPLPSQFGTIEHKLIEGKEEAIIASWHRLLAELKYEVEQIKTTGSEIVPSINYGDLRNETRSKAFATVLKKRGAGIVSGVVCKDVVESWMGETQQYVSHNSLGNVTSGRQTHDIFWSPAQIRARAHPNILDTQRLLMKLWHTSEADPLTPNFPIMYADRLHGASSATTNGRTEPLAQISGGSVERWEPDARAPSYQEIWDGCWEDYDPWTTQKRLQLTSNSYNSTETCSAVQLWQGLFCLADDNTRTVPVRICPMLRLSTAYILLRPFFAPKTPCPEDSNFLSPDNWIMQSPISSVLHGAAPSQRQEVSDILHPHLRLSETLISTPLLQPGDYLIFHPDTIVSPQASSTIAMSLPICPLTRTNALYLLRQRKAFLLGQSPPDFQQNERDDSRWVGRLGVQEVSDTGGEDALRAMGLAPWDEDDVEDVMEAEVLEEANNVLFPDRHDFDMDWT